MENQVKRENKVIGIRINGEVHELDLPAPRALGNPFKVYCGNNIIAVPLLPLGLYMYRKDTSQFEEPVNKFASVIAQGKTQGNVIIAGEARRALTAEEIIRLAEFANTKLTLLFLRHPETATMHELQAPLQKWIAPILERQRREGRMPTDTSISERNNSAYWASVSALRRKFKVGK